MERKEEIKMDTFGAIIEVGGEDMEITFRARDLTHAWVVAKSRARAIGGIVIEVYAYF